MEEPRAVAHLGAALVEGANPSGPWGYVGQVNIFGPSCKDAYLGRSPS
jgi:hypothetical protein